MLKRNIFIITMNSKSLVKNIKNRMDQKGLSIAELERLISVPGGAVRHILKETSKNPSVFLIAKIAKFFECSVEELILESSQNSISNMIISEKDPIFFKSSQIKHLSELNTPLFKECLFFLIDQGYEIDFDFNRIETLTQELYSYSVQNNNERLDSHFGNWLLSRN